MRFSSFPTPSTRPRTRRSVFTATMTSKGQITIPAQLRRRLGLSPGTKVDFRPLDSSRFAARAHRPPRVLDVTDDLPEQEGQR